MLTNGTKAFLVLEGGAVFEGRSFGAEIDGLGEVCFNTSLSGYQEILTDPSYHRQIVTMTYPMIGNYGVNRSENESEKIRVAGLVVKEYVPEPSNFNSELSLGDFLKEAGVPGIQGLDTRRLVLQIRREGAQRGGIFIAPAYRPDMLEQVRALPSMEGLDLAREVTAQKAYQFGQSAGKRFRVAVLDFGVKTNILRMLSEKGFDVHVFPATTPASELQAANFDCYFLSNGPGDPAPMTYAVDTVRALIAEGKPIFGICLGHQLIGLATGRTSFKLKFGHRGGNQPVKNYKTGRVEITSQNHGFAISDQQTGSVDITHVNLNDQTVEGFADPDRPLMCVQYHPEAAPGPHDAAYLFDDFFTMVERYHAGRQTAT